MGVIIEIACRLVDWIWLHDRSSTSDWMRTRCISSDVCTSPSIVGRSFPPATKLSLCFRPCSNTAIPCLISNFTNKALSIPTDCPQLYEYTTCSLSYGLAIMTTQQSFALGPGLQIQAPKNGRGLCLLSLGDPSTVNSQSSKAYY